ncbi:MAG: patatin-like phospholipase family protein [Bacillota bacterium]
MSKFRILSFDGGGIRGALSINLLRRIYSNYSKIITDTNLFAGTSTGSLIALGLAYGLTIEEIADFYSIETGRYIFSPKGLGLLSPKYSNRKLKEVLLRVFPKNLRLKDLNKYVVIPSFRVNGSQAKSWSPIFFSNFPDSNTKGVTVIDAAMSSSAAPVYFPSYKQHIDGGLIANNPCTAAISIASDPYFADEITDNIYLLSIGTGFNPHKITGDTSRWGLLQWLFNQNPPLPLETIMFEGAIEADSYFSYQILKDRFYRINPELSGKISLDDYHQIPYLVSLAESYDLSQTMAWLYKYWVGDVFMGEADIDKTRAKYWHNVCNSI